MIALLIVTVVVGLGIAALLWTINAKTRARMPKVGELAPGFALPDQGGASRSLGELQGKWVVLYFYPRDDTPGCAEQAMRFRNTMRDLEALGAVVCGVSVDDSESHAAFARKYNLPFTLLADRGGEVAASYGSLLNLGVVRFAKRNTFLIDPQGKVSKVYLGVNAGRNAQEVSDDLKTITRE